MQLGKERAKGFVADEVAASAATAATPATAANTATAATLMGDADPRQDENAAEAIAAAPELEQAAAG